MARHDPAGRAVRPALPAPQSGLRCRGHPDARPRHRREHGHLLGRAWRAPAIPAVRGWGSARAPARGRGGGRDQRRSVLAARDEGPEGTHPQLFRRRRVPLDVVRPARQAGARAGPDGRRVGQLLRSARCAPDPRPHVPAGRGPARRRAGPRAVARLLDAGVRRRSRRGRPRLPDERPSAHRRRRPASHPRLSAGQRRLDADLRVPLPIRSGDGERSGRRDAPGIRAAEARLDPGGRAPGPDRGRGQARGGLPEELSEDGAPGPLARGPLRGAHADGAAHLPHAVRNGRPRTAARLRQRRQPHARAADAAPPGAGAALGARGGTGPAGAPAADRKRPARARGRRARPRRRGGRAADAGPLRRALHAARGRDRPERARAPLLARGVAGRRHRARPDSRAVAPAQPHGLAPGGTRADDGRRRPPARAQSPDRDAGRDLVRAARRSRA